MAEAQMSENVLKNGKKLSAKQEKAANLVSEDFLPDEKIAAEVGINPRTLTRWKADRAFIARVGQISEAFAERALTYGLARRAKRVALLNRNHDKLEQVVAERSADPELANIPGGKTGLVTKSLKGIGKGSDYQVVEVYEVDTGTLREMRAIYEQVAEELGQKSNKVDVTQHTVPFDHLSATDEEILRFILNSDSKDDGGLSEKLHAVIYEHTKIHKTPEELEESKQNRVAHERENTSLISSETLAMIQAGTQPDSEDDDGKLQL